MKELYMATEPFIGTLTTFGGTFTIQSWATCFGQVQAISENAALFSLLGTLYGGDGRTTFAIPDLRGRSPVGQGTMPGGFSYQQGIKMGSERVILDKSQLPEHTHTAAFTANSDSSIKGKLEVATDKGVLKTPVSNSYLAAGSTSANYISPGLGGVTLTEIQGLTVSGGSTGGTVVIGSTGNNSPVVIVNPVLPLNWLIALQGIYPSRS